MATTKGIMKTAAIVAAVLASAISQRGRGDRVDGGREVVAILKNEPDAAAREQKIRAKLAGAVADAQFTAQLNSMESPWFRYFLQHNPADARAE